MLKSILDKYLVKKDNWFHILLLIFTYSYMYIRFEDDLNINIDLLQNLLLNKIIYDPLILYIFIT